MHAASPLIIASTQATAAATAVASSRHSERRTNLLSLSGPDLGGDVDENLLALLRAILQPSTARQHETLHWTGLQQSLWALCKTINGL